MQPAVSREIHPASPHIAIDVLAGEVRRDSRTVPLSRGDHALLVVLALQRRPCSRDELIELLYPHLEFSSAASQLKVYVHRVRRRLGDPGVIAFHSDRYRLGAHVQVDLWEVEADVAE